MLLVKKCLLVFAIVATGFLNSSLLAQDNTPPTLELVATTVTPAGKFDNFIFVVRAQDDQQLEGLEIRGKVNGKPLDPWMSYPYYDDYPIVISVDCDYFRFDVRAKDGSGNYSKVISREFRKPFDGPNSGAIGKVPSIPFVADAELPEPPAVIVADKSATLIFKSVSLPSKKLKSLFSSELVATRSVAERAAKKKRPVNSITYQATYTNKTLATLQKKTAKKNSLVLKKLPAGEYESTYRAELRQNGKIIATTKDSPPVKFTILP